MCLVDLFRYLPLLCTTQGQSECWLTLLHPFCLLTSFPLYQTDDGFWIEKITFQSLQNFPFCWFLIKIFMAELSRKRYGIFNYMWGCVSESENVAVNKNLQKSSIINFYVYLRQKRVRWYQKFYWGQTSIKKAKNEIRVLKRSFTLKIQNCENHAKIFFDFLPPMKCGHPFCSVGENKTSWCLCRRPRRFDMQAGQVAHRTNKE